MNESEKTKIQLCCIIAILLLIILLLGWRDGQKENDNLKLQSDNETLQIKALNLISEVESNEKRVDTVYTEKLKIKRIYEDSIVYLNTLDSSQHDSLFNTLYPSKDSANRTYYRYNDAKIQLKLDSNIIKFKDSNIFDLKNVIQINDTIHRNDSLILFNTVKQAKKDIRKARNKGRVEGGVIGFIFGLLIP